MSDFQHKDMSGTIFKNRFKEDGDNKPEYRGEIMVRGELLEIALWVKDGAKGKFFSAKVQEKRTPEGVRANPAPTRASVPRSSLRDDLSDEVPF
jgi:hypothetical protein